MLEMVHPILPFAAAAAAMPFLGVNGRRITAIVAPLIAVALIFALPQGPTLAGSILGLDLTLMKVDALGRIFAIAFALSAVIGGVFSWQDTTAGAKAAALGLAGGAIGLALAGDLLSLFVFWEMLAICSMFLICHGKSPQSLAAGMRYVIFHLASGTCLLAGIILHIGQTGSTAIDSFTLGNAAGWLMLIGVAANAAVPPLHAWLPDAYPRASVFGTVFLSAFTTKAAVYALARLFPAQEPLVWLGAAMALYGVVFAVLENDIRRLLAYHIISQVGYMVCGVGLGTDMAINGTAAHAFCHIFYKGLLMMSAGAVIYATGRGKLTELGGLAGPLKWTLVMCMIGAFSISGVPLFNGFVSKSMVVSAAAEAHRAPIELMLLVASMGTFLHTGLKLPWFVFFGDNPTPAPVHRPVHPSMLTAMGMAAAVCIVTGIAPGLLYNALPNPVNYHPYTPDHVVMALQMLIGTALGFWLLRGMLGGQATVTMDVDIVYRRSVPAAIAAAGEFFQAIFRWTEQHLTSPIPLVRDAWVRYQHVAWMTTAHHAAIVVLVVAGIWALANLF